MTGGDFNFSAAGPEASFSSVERAAFMKCLSVQVVDDNLIEDNRSMVAVEINPGSLHANDVTVVDQVEVFIIENDGTVLTCF